MRLAPSVLAAALLTAAWAPGQSAPLSLGEVLNSAERSYPVLLIAIQQRVEAEGKALSALGAFDTKLSLQSEMNQFGFYKNRVNGGKVSQPLRDFGGEVFGGYERGQGNFGPWEEDLLTLNRGEWSGGVRLPLFRDREIDERRTDLLLAELGIELADASIRQQRLKLLESAAKSYWEWVSAGQKLAITEALLKIAQDRNDQVRELVDAGQAAAIEITDNRRAVLERQSAVVSAERTLQNAAFALSLFFRDDAGDPVVVDRVRLPDFPEPTGLTPQQLEEDLERALEIRPEVEGTLVELRRNQASIDLARNQLLPQVDVTAQFGRDTGDGSITKRGSELAGGISFELPFQRRKAKGEVALQQAKNAQLAQKLRLNRDKIAFELRDAASALELALQRLELARAEADTSQQLAEAERERFELGDSTLFIVNLREIAAASARMKVVSAIAECHKARAVYLAAAAAF